MSVFNVITFRDVGMKNPIKLLIGFLYGDL